MRHRFRRKSARAARRPPVLYPLLGAALLPPTLGLWIALVRVLPSLPFSWSSVGPAAAGAAAYALVHWVFQRPMGLYVFGHELTHATAAWLSGYRVKSLFVSEKGGEVQLSDTNVGVALAPYCVPLYTLAVVGVYFWIDHYARFPSPPVGFGLALGATLAFHVALTVHALRQHQPDLHYAGLVFSMAAILFCNTVVLALTLKVLFPGAVSLPSLAVAAAVDTRLVVEKTAEAVYSGGGRVLAWARALRP